MENTRQKFESHGKLEKALKVFKEVHNNEFFLIVINVSKHNQAVFKFL